MRNSTTAAAAALFLSLAGCSSAPPLAVEKKEPEKVEPVTGQTAVGRMYLAARSWASDAQILKAASLHIAEAPDGPPESGAAPAWTATFVSPAKSEMRTYTYSIVESTGNLHKDSFAGSPERWSGSSGANITFPISALHSDTAAAYKTAMTTPLSKAAEYDKKNPGKVLTYLLERTTKHPYPVWRILWGTSPTTSNFSVVVDASTGAYVETLR